MAATSTMDNIQGILEKLRMGVKSADDSSHPTETADDGTQAATEGEHAKELDQAVEETTENTAGSSTPPPGPPKPDDILGVGAAPTGDDPKAEDNIGDGKTPDDTSHPASMEHGEKYASMQDEPLRKLRDKVANELLTVILSGGGFSEAQAPAAKSAADAQKQAAAQAGYEFGSSLAGNIAIDEEAMAYSSNIVKLATVHADMVAGWFAKTGNEMMEGESDDTQTPSEGAPVDGGPGEGDMPMPPPEAAPMGAEGGEMPPAGAGGPPPGMPPEAGGPPGAPPGGDPAGGVGGALDSMEPDDIKQLIEALVQVLAEKEQGPKDLEALAPKAASMGIKLDFKKLAEQCRIASRSGKITLGPPQTLKQATTRKEMHRMLADLSA